jgi:cytochrome c553
MPSRTTLQCAAASALALGCALAANAQDAPGKLADTIEQRLAACTICHGEQGEGVGSREYYPRISGKPARYLYLQLVNFRDGRRTYPQMVYLFRYMPDAYLQEIADYYAKLKPPYVPPAPPPASARELERGETLVTKGDPGKNVPACNACHGKGLTGMQPAIPGLVGLNFDYLAGQLGAWKSGARRANAPDCMHEIATRLAGADIAAVAKYIASRPLDPKLLAAPEAPRRLPLACGSQSS